MTLPFCKYFLVRDLRTTNSRKHGIRQVGVRYCHLLYERNNTYVERCGSLSFNRFVEFLSSFHLRLRLLAIIPSPMLIRFDPFRP